MGSGCASVGREVASDTRGWRFESSHRQKFISILNICLLSTVYWKDENKEKEAGCGPFFLKKSTSEKYYVCCFEPLLAHIKLQAFGILQSKGSFTVVRIPQWTVAFLQRDRKFSISELTQSTAENADCCSKCESAFMLALLFFFQLHKTFPLVDVSLNVDLR